MSRRLHVILSERGEVGGSGVEAKGLALATLHNARAQTTITCHLTPVT